MLRKIRCFCLLEGLKAVMEFVRIKTRLVRVRVRVRVRVNSRVIDVRDKDYKWFCPRQT
jgi:hypothetical protein